MLVEVGSGKETDVLFEQQGCSRGMQLLRACLGHQHVHGSHGLPVLVQPHVEGLDGLRGGEGEKGSLGLDPHTISRM